MELNLKRLNGKRLFERETFGGNGRTCGTCHTKRTGTLTLDDVQRIIEKSDPDDPFLDSRRARRRSQHDAGPEARNHPAHHPAAAVGLDGG